MAHFRSHLRQRGAKRKRSRLAFCACLWITLVIFVAILTAWVVLRSGMFSVRSISIYGNERVSDARVRSLLLASVTRGSFVRSVMTHGNLLVWPSSLDAAALRTIPGIRSVKIEKDYTTRSVSVYVEERKEKGIWCAGTSCFWFDEDGVAFQRTAGTEGNLISSVKDMTGRDVGLGARLLEGEPLAYFFMIIDTLGDAELSVKAVRMKDLALHEIEVETHNGPLLRFSLEFPPVSALEALAKIAEETDLHGLEYVDFRIENKVFYK